MKDIWKILMVVSALLGLAIGILSIVKGDCGGVIECATGNVPMKCHWTFLATSALGFGSAVMSLVGLGARTKNARVMVAIAILVMLVVTAVIAWALIGVCAMHECNGNRTLLTVIIALNAVIALIGCAKADPNKADMPKARL